MKNTTVQSSELGDDWTPAAHMPRLLCYAHHVQEGDRIRVRDHRSTTESEHRWHLVTVQAVDKGDRGTLVLSVDKWPIAYVCSMNELVELVEIKRTAFFRCMICHRVDYQDQNRITVTMEDFLDPGLMKRGGLHVAIITPIPEPVAGYCKEHGTDLLA